MPMTKQLRRVALVVAAGLAVVAPARPAPAQANQTDTPTFLVVPFASGNEAALGVEVANAVRARMLHHFPVGRDGSSGLRIVTRDSLNHLLQNKGIAADSEVVPAALRYFGRELGATESMEGVVRRTVDGVEVKARSHWRNDIESAEVLPTVVAPNATAAGEALADEYVRARSELPDYERCRAGLITRDYDGAAEAARTGMAQFSGGVLSRTCLMEAWFGMYTTRKAPPDSAIRNGRAILEIDPDNERALGMLADLYLSTGDTAKAVQMNVRLYQVNRSRSAPTGLDGPIALVDGGIYSIRESLAMMKDAVQANPHDVAVLGSYWKTLLLAREWTAAIAAGEAMVAADPSTEDSLFLNRQISAALADSQPALVLSLLERAVRKYPTSTRYLLGYSQELRRQGQLEQSLAVAERAVAIDPRVSNGYATVLSLMAALGRTDSALAIAKVALAMGGDRADIGNALLTLLRPRSGDAPVNWQEVYSLSVAADSLVPQPATAFYVVYSALNIADGILREIPTIAKTDKPLACARLRQASEYLTIAEWNRRGGSADRFGGPTALDRLATRLKPDIEARARQLGCR